MISIVRKGGKQIILPVASSVASSSSSSIISSCASCTCILSSTRRSLASSTAIIDVLPNSIKEAVKTSILDEVSKPDSKLWSSSNNNDDHDHDLHHSTLSKSQTNGLSNNNTSHNYTNNATHEKNHDNHNTTNPNPNINNPISTTRYRMLHDPLDEWHLSSQPGSILSPQNASIQKPPLDTTNDPFILSQQDLQSLSLNIRRDLIGYDHPVLTQVAGYFFEDGKDGGKKIRPMMVLLLSRAMVASTSSTQNELLFTSQKRLAEISEMIHTASLFHDDVIDKAETRRGSPAVHQVFGNKMAILAGDYLLARASVFLARLRNVEVVETMSTIIEHLVRGEVMQMKGSSSNSSRSYHYEHDTSSDSMMMEGHIVHYLRKNFYKTASLMANSCKSAAILGNYNDEIVQGAYKYGKHLGVAFQLVDDVLDFDGSVSDMGKAALADLNAGLATAPVLFAAEKYPDEILPMMERKFRNNGDVDRALALVRQTDGIQRTKDLAQVHVELAIESILTSLGPSAYRDALVHLAHKVVDRTR